MSDRRGTDEAVHGPGDDDTLVPDGEAVRPDVEVGAEPAAVTDAVEGRTASLWGDAWRQLRRSPLFIVSGTCILVFIVMATFPGLFTDTDPTRVFGLDRSTAPPTAGHPFGFDVQGRDYLARTIYGARVSISIGLVVTLFSTLIAVTLGTVSAYYGGILDALIARLTDIAFALPFILGALVILSVFGQGFVTVAFTLVVLGWPTMLRLMRSSVLATKDADYVEAARSLGASDVRIMARHILPNAVAPVIVYATIYVGVIISAEAALSFLGAGLQLPAISWGLMISEAQHRITSAPHLLLFPGAFLSVAVFSFILMGDALRDALDPKLR